MIRVSATTIMLRTAIFGIIAGSVLSANLRTASGQTLPSHLDDVKFMLAIPGMNPHVKVTRLLLDGKLVPFNSPVPVSGNWMGQIVVEIQNISAKEIVAGEILLLYPETGSGMPDSNSPIMSSVTRLGREPSTAFRLKDGTSRPVPDWMASSPEVRIPPGSTMRFEFGIDDTQAEAYRLAGQIHIVKVDPRFFYFGDGSKWQGGTFLSPVPPPALWQVAPTEQFFQNGGTESIREGDGKGNLGEQL